MIRFACPGCSATFTVADEKAGKNGKCPKCNSQFVIPAADPAPDAPTVDAPFPQLPPPPTPAPEPPPSSYPASPQPVEIQPCPTCGSRLSVLPTEVGLDIQCPNCQGVFQAVRADAPPPPDAGSKRSSGGALVKLGSGGRQEEDDDQPSKRRSRRDDDDDDDRPSRYRRRSRRDDDDDDDDDRPRRRSRRGGYGGGCPYCGTSAAPYYRSQISTGGWITFALLLAFCWPLFWIGLLIREDVNVCSDCGGKLG